MSLRASLALLFLVGSATAAAQGPPAAGCDTGLAEAELNVAGVRAKLFNTGGLFWRGNAAVYEVPRLSGRNAIFSTGLMVGGLVGGEVRFAGSTYGPWEYWPGPLAPGGTTTPETCAAYDRIWVVRTADLDTYAAGGGAAPDLASWPVGVGAPFYVDGNGNGRQDASEPTVSLDPGDPGYGPRALNLAAGERPVIFGRQTAWWVMNDAGGGHGWSDNDGEAYRQPIGVEVRVTAWADSRESEPALAQSTFYRFEVINRSARTLATAHAGLYVDSDLGSFNDDRVGTDSTRQMLVFYNGDDFDEGGDGYGDRPPALGIDALSGAWAGPIPYKNGTYGEPVGAQTGYNYLRGVWRDGSPVRVGGLGYDTDGPVTRWAFSGDMAAQAFWSQENIDGAGATINPSDKRGMISSLPADLAPGERLVFDVAILFATGADRLDSVTELRAVSDRAQALYRTGALTVPGSDPAPPPTPTPLSPTEAVEGDEVTFAWEPVPGADGYLIDLFTDADGTVPIPSIGRDLPSTVETSLTLSSNWFPVNRRAPLYWRVRAVRSGLDSPPSELLSFTYFRPAFDRLSVLANASGPLDPPLVSPHGGFSARGDAGRQQSTGAVWDVEVAGGFVGPGFATAFPRDYEVRFVAQPGAEAIGIQASTGFRVRVPFELWDIGVGTPDDPDDDVRLVPVLSNLDPARRFEAPDGPSGVEELTASVAWYAPRDMAPGERGYRAWADPAAQTLPDSAQRVLLPMAFRRGTNASNGARPRAPEPGTVFQFESSAQALAVATPEAGAALALEVRPNPTAARATVAYRLMAPGPVRLMLVDVLGRVVAVLAEGQRPEGEHRAALDAAALAPGVYVVVLRSGDARAVRTITVAR